VPGEKLQARQGHRTFTGGDNVHTARQGRTNIAQPWFSIAERGPGCFDQDIAAGRLQSLQDVRPMGHFGMSSEGLSYRHKIE